MFFVFYIFKHNPHFLHHSFLILRYRWSFIFAFLELVVHVARSLANWESLHKVSFGISDTNSEMGIGDRQDPWGTPALILKVDESNESNLTYPSLLVRKLLIIICEHLHVSWILARFVNSSMFVNIRIDVCKQLCNLYTMT